MNLLCIKQLIDINVLSYIYVKIKNSNFNTWLISSEIHYSLENKYHKYTLDTLTNKDDFNYKIGTQTFLIK